MPKPRLQTVKNARALRSRADVAVVIEPDSGANSSYDPILASLIAKKSKQAKYSLEKGTVRVIKRSPFSNRPTEIESTTPRKRPSSAGYSLAAGGQIVTALGFTPQVGWTTRRVIDLNEMVVSDDDIDEVTLDNENAFSKISVRQPGQKRSVSQNQVMGVPAKELFARLFGELSLPDDFDRSVFLKELRVHHAHIVAHSLNGAQDSENMRVTTSHCNYDMWRIVEKALREKLASGQLTDVELKVRPKEIYIKKINSGIASKFDYTTKIGSAYSTAFFKGLSQVKSNSARDSLREYFELFLQYAQEMLQQQSVVANAPVCEPSLIR